MNVQRCLQGSGSEFISAAGAGPERRTSPGGFRDTFAEMNSEKK